MKQFKTILKFELANLLGNKIFKGVTLAIVVLLAVVMFFPRVKDALVSSDAGEASEQQAKTVMAIAADEAYADGARELFAGYFPDYDVQLVSGEEEVRTQVEEGAAECGFALHSLTSYTYYVDNLTMYDEKSYTADEALQNLYRVNAMMEKGMTPEEAGEILSVQIEHETESLGKDQIQNFFYTYIMIFALYMVILLYGQMVATNVASEKSTRAMELLVTSAKPTAMMFGKVIASCIAGLVQLICIFGPAVLFYQINKEYWNNPIVASIFDMPVWLLLFMLLFFILGFFIYAFMFGAVGSTASKVEDINTSSMPVMMLFIIAFLVTMFSMSSGNVDNLLMKICSFIPFTSPMAMFTRIAMSTVPWYEIVIFVAILIGSVFGIGVLAAKIYRVGVLMYGTTPKISQVIKSVLDLPSKAKNA